MTAQAPADWYPDPSGRYEHRYWDGLHWTQNVASHGHQSIEPPAIAPPAATAHPISKKIQRQMQNYGVAGDAQTISETLLSEPVLVVNQKAKLFEVSAEYAVYNRHGQQVGAVREVGQNFMKKAMAVRAENDRTRRLHVIDTNGEVLLRLTRPAKLIKSKMIVAAGDGSPIGQIVQKTVGLLGKIRFDLEAGGQAIGSMNADGWDAWDFGIQNAAGAEVARVSKDWAGVTKQSFTKADNYVVQIHGALEDPLRSLVVAASLAVDTALFQGASNSSRGQWRLGI
ncbi:phospholipid scramblase-related protein [Microbacterium sp. A84]|uniref:phospholipid scramblase-related protein n=1 Tax=Microbacterium sp. A84 TaxID=3450715 RepID=UPI003F442BF3